MDVYISESNLSDAGMGLFANKIFKKDDIIVDYSGELLTMEQARNSDSYYLFKVGKDTVIDAENSESLGRYCNDPIKFSKYNAKIKAHTKTETASIVATKKIKKGEEIYVSYGIDYWMNTDHFDLLKSSNQNYLYKNSIKRFVQWVDDNYDM